MKKIFLAAFAFLVAITTNAAPPGRNLELLRDQNGSPRLGVQFAVGVDKFVSIVFSARGSELVGNAPDTVAPSKWAIVDKVTGAKLTKWSEYQFGQS